MKKGINSEYDQLRDKLFELRFKIEILRRDQNKIQELEQTMKETDECLMELKRLEKNSIRK